jgi:hypothetical protein
MPTRSRWEIGWDGIARPYSGTEASVPDARAAAERTAGRVNGIWDRPGVYVRVIGPYGGVWGLHPVPQRPGKLAWCCSARRSRRAEEPVREIGGICIPTLVAQLRERTEGRGAKQRPDPLSATAAAVILALTGASA